MDTAYDATADTHYLRIGYDPDGFSLTYCTAFYHTGATDAITAVGLHTPPTGINVPVSLFARHDGTSLSIECNEYPPPSSPPSSPPPPSLPPPSAPLTLVTTTNVGTD